MGTQIKMNGQQSCLFLCEDFTESVQQHRCVFRFCTARTPVGTLFSRSGEGAEALGGDGATPGGEGPAGFLLAKRRRLSETEGFGATIPKQTVGTLNQNEKWQSNYIFFQNISFFPLLQAV